IGDVTFSDLKRGVVLTPNELLPCHFGTDARLYGIWRNASALQNLSKLRNRDVLPRGHILECAIDFRLANFEAVDFCAGNFQPIVDQVGDDLLTVWSFLGDSLQLHSLLDIVLCDRRAIRNDDNLGMQGNGRTETQGDNGYCQPCSVP